MQILWPSSTPVSAVTAAASTDVCSATAHGFLDGDPVFFISGTGFTGITAGRRYFVRDAATDTFKLAATAGGGAIDITVDGSDGVFAAAVTIDNGERGENDPGETFEGHQLTEFLEIATAGSDVPLSRGKRHRTLPLKIPHDFASERLAGLFHFQRYDQLADFGPLLVVVGATGDTADLYADAVLESCVPRWLFGLIVVVDYQFLVGAFSA